MDVSTEPSSYVGVNCGWPLSALEHLMINGHVEVKYWVSKLVAAGMDSDLARVVAINKWKWAVRL